jgi:CBS-domain-containing membrane protein
MEYDGNHIHTEVEIEEPRAQNTALVHPAVRTYAEMNMRQSIDVMRAPSSVLIAVVDEAGYLVPVWSAGDLLRACNWRTSQD